MSNYVVRRLLWGMTAVFGVATLVFFLIRVVPGDVASLALWLAGDEAGYASGQLWTLDGGLTAQVQQMRLGSP